MDVKAFGESAIYKNMIPIGGAIVLRNATLEDHTWRTGGGAVKLGVVTPGAGNLNHGIDYWPIPTSQRNVVSQSDGSIDIDDGTGNNWKQLVTGLSTVSPYNPFLSLGGAEAAGRVRKCFYCDGQNPVWVLAGDAGTDAPIANPGVAPGGALAAGTALSIGAYLYAYAWVTANGETLVSPTFSITTTTGNQVVNLTGIAVGPAGTTTRRLYRTKVGGTQLFFVTTLNDNVTTTFQDTIQDVLIGVTTPTVPVTNNTTATAHKIGRPPADWNALGNQPSGLVSHQGYNWAFGNQNSPHTLYRSLQSDHEDFLSTPYTLNLFPGESQYIACGLSFKGGMLVWKYPTGAYFIDTTDPNPTNWQQKRVGNAGASGPTNAVLLENDAVWVSPDASWHLASATYATGSVHASDIAYRKLGQFPRQQLNVSRLAFADLVYYTQKREVHLACAAPGAVAITRRLVLDLNREQDQGERWHFWDRDDNECLYLRRGSDSTPSLVMGDNVGQLWMLDQISRDKAGQAYTFEFFMADTDFSQFVPQWAGKWKNLRYVQIEWDPHSQASLTLEAYRDGKLSQTITVPLTASGLVLPFNLPGTFGADTLQVSNKRTLLGRARRMALRGYITQTDADVSISRLIVGVEVGE